MLHHGAISTCFFRSSSLTCQRAIKAYAIIKQKVLSISRNLLRYGTRVHCYTRCDYPFYPILNSGIVAFYMCSKSHGNRTIFFIFDFTFHKFLCWNIILRCIFVQKKTYTIYFITLLTLYHYTKSLYNDI